MCKLLYALYQLRKIFSNFFYCHFFRNHLYQKSKIDFPKASIFFRSPLGKSENERSLMYDSGTCVFGEAAGAAVAGAASCPSPPSARTTTFGPVFDDNALLDDDDDDDDEC